MGGLGVLYYWFKNARRVAYPGSWWVRCFYDAERRREAEAAYGEVDYNAGWGRAVAAIGVAVVPTLVFAVVVAMAGDDDDSIDVAAAAITAVVGIGALAIGVRRGRRPK